MANRARSWDKKSLRRARGSWRACRRVLIVLQAIWVAGVVVAASSVVALLFIANPEGSAKPGMAAAREALLLVAVFGVFACVALPILGWLLRRMISFAAASGAAIGSDQRILVLRPFDRETLTENLRALMRRHVAGLGFAYTLADQAYLDPAERRERRFEEKQEAQQFRLQHARRPHNASGGVFEWAILLFKLFRWAARTLFPKPVVAARVKNDKHLARLKRRLEKRGAQTVAFMDSFGEPLGVESADTYWQTIVSYLLDNADLILMDVSKVGAGSAWEINTMLSTAKVRECIFLCDVGEWEPQLELLSKQLGFQPPFYLYDYDGSIYALRTPQNTDLLGKDARAAFDSEVLALLADEAP